MPRPARCSATYVNCGVGAMKFVVSLEFRLPNFLTSAASSVLRSNFGCDDVDSGKVSAGHKIPRNFSLSRARQGDLLRHACMSRQECTHHFPRPIEHLHEALVIWNRAHDQILRSVELDRIRPALARGDDPDPQTSCPFELTGIDLHCRAHPLIGLSVAEKQVRLPQAADALRKRGSQVARSESASDGTDVAFQQNWFAAISGHETGLVGQEFIRGLDQHLRPGLLRAEQYGADIGTLQFTLSQGVTYALDHLGIRTR
jgi:hypothetical protein